MKSHTSGLLIAFTLMLYTTDEFSQSFNFGLTAGISSGTVKVSEIGSAITNTIHGDNILGYEGGLFARLNFDPLYVKGMLLAASRTGTSDYMNSDGTTRSSDFTVSKIELPVLFGLRFIGPIRVEAGPVINWLFHENHAIDESFNLRKTGYGYRIGANVEIGIINLGLSYQGLKNNSDGSGSATFSSPDELIFTFGLILSGSKY